MIDRAQSDDDSLSDAAMAAKIESERPNASLTVREATLEQMFDEIAGRIGVAKKNNGFVLICKLEPNSNRVAVFTHGNSFDLYTNVVHSIHARTKDDPMVRAVLAMALVNGPGK